MQEYVFFYWHCFCQLLWAYFRQDIGLRMHSLSENVCVCVCVQEKVYSSYGRHAREAMFYNVCGYLCLSSSLILCLLSTSIQHALPLPGFLLLAPGIWNKILTYSASGLSVSCLPNAYIFTKSLATVYISVHSHTRRLERTSVSDLFCSFSSSFAWTHVPPSYVALPPRQLSHSVSTNTQLL